MIAARGQVHLSRLFPGANGLTISFSQRSICRHLRRSPTIGLTSCRTKLTGRLFVTLDPKWDAQS
jgi:hypothetical protein